MNKQQCESGNVFFYIMLGIALLAALSYAIAQGSRDSVQDLTDTRQRLVAGEIIAFGDTMAKAVSQLRLRGTTISQLRFSHPDLPDVDYGTYNSTPGNEIFNPSGGALSYQPGSAEMSSGGTQEDYEFLSNNEVEQVGSTCGAASCSDLIMSLPDVSLNICLQINDLLGVDNPGGTPPDDTDIHEAAKFQGTFGFTRTIGDEDAALTGKREACFQETGEANEYVYYKVLLAR